MQQVKIFNTVEPELEAMEKQVNAWLKESKVRVISITGNIAPQTVTAESKGLSPSKSGFAPSDVLLVVLYETP